MYDIQTIVGCDMAYQLLIPLTRHMRIHDRQVMIQCDMTCQKRPSLTLDTLWYIWYIHTCMKIPCIGNIRKAMSIYIDY